MTRQKDNETGQWGWVCFGHVYLMPEGPYMRPKAVGRWVTDEYLQELERNAAKP